MIYTFALCIIHFVLKVCENEYINMSRPITACLKIAICNDLSVSY